MNTYEQEIFEFFTNEDNFRNMFKIAGHYGMVKKKLFEDFWKIVHEELANLNLQENNTWNIIKLEKIESKASKILMYKKNWCNEKGDFILALGYERLASETFPFYGVFLNNHLVDYDLNAIRNFATNLPIARDYDTSDNTWWPFWASSGLDFSNPEELIKILPSNRIELACSFATTLFQLAKEMEMHIDIMVKMKKAVGQP